MSHHGEAPAASVRLQDVARAAGVHISTASRALGPGGEDRLSEATVTKVRAAAARLGYRPDPIATGLRRGTTMTVGVVVSDFENPFIGPILRGIAEVVEQRGFVTLVAETVEDHGRLERIFEHFRSRRVSAIVVSAARSSDAHLISHTAATGIPVVLALRGIDIGELPSVVADDADGARLAAEHLLDLGHRRFAQLRGPEDVSSFARRSEGFRHTIGRNGGVDLTVANIAETPTLDAGRRLMELTLDQGGTLPTAVFAHTDVMAIAAIQTLRRRGLICPRDMSVVGYNDAPLTDSVDPPLSTVRISAEVIGQEAARIALEQIDEPTAMPASIVCSGHPRATAVDRGTANGSAAPAGESRP